MDDTQMKGETSATEAHHIQRLEIRIDWSIDFNKAAFACTRIYIYLPSSQRRTNKWSSSRWFVQRGIALQLSWAGFIYEQR